MASKAYWGYSDAFMAACRDELTVNASDIANPRITINVATRNSALIGFYTLTTQSAHDWELHALFVTPDSIRTGAGGQLLTHALETLRAAGAHRLSIQSDPGAAPFYIANGAVKTGETPSGSIPGRTLPQLEITLTPTSGAEH